MAPVYRVVRASPQQIATLAEVLSASVTDTKAIGGMSTPQNITRLRDNLVIALESLQTILDNCTERVEQPR